MSCRAFAHYMWFLFISHKLFAQKIYQNPCYKHKKAPAFACANAGAA